MVLSPLKNWRKNFSRLLGKFRLNMLRQYYLPSVLMPIMVNGLCYPRGYISSFEVYRHSMLVLILDVINAVIILVTNSSWAAFILNQEHIASVQFKLESTSCILIATVGRHFYMSLAGENRHHFTGMSRAVI